MPKKAAELRKESLAWLPCADAALGVRSVLQQLLAEPPGYKLRGRLRERVKANIMAFGDALVTCHPPCNASERATDMLNTYLPY